MKLTTDQLGKLRSLLALTLGLQGEERAVALIDFWGTAKAFCAESKGFCGTAAVILSLIDDAIELRRREALESMLTEWLRSNHDEFRHHIRGQRVSGTSFVQLLSRRADAPLDTEWTVYSGEGENEYDALDEALRKAGT